MAAPTVDQGIADTSSNEDTLVSYTFAADAFNDDDGDETLTYAATLSNDDPLPLWLSFDGPTRTFSGTPPTDFNGTISIKVTASDGTDSISDTFDLVITPVNDAPVAQDASDSGNEDGGAIAGNVVATDVDGDSLTYILVDEVDSAEGTLTFGSDGSYSFEPAADFNGVATFTYKANDGSADSNVATVTITVDAVNDDPDAVDDTASGTEDQDVVIDADDLLANDGDVDGDTLTVSGVGNAVGGTVSLDGDEVTFTPDENFNGEASFTYDVSDGNGGTDTATVTIDIAAVNDPVTVAAPTTFNPTNTEDLPASGNFAVSIADVDTVLEPDGIYTFAISASDGTLTLASTTGLTFVDGPDGDSDPDGDGTEDSSLRFTGKLADINAALASVSYTGRSGTIDVFVTDTGGATVATGSGPATSDSDSINVVPIYFVEGTDGDDVIIAQDPGGIYFIDGERGNDVIVGGDLGDNLDGGMDDDNVSGGGGDDFIEGGQGNDQLFGNDGDDTLEGSPGDDLLDGGTGADTMEGGPGDDTFVVDDEGDEVGEGVDNGTDTVITNLASYTLGVHLENLIGTSALGGQILTGNASDNIIEGSAAGPNVMTGLGGDDWYVVRHPGDVVIEAPGGGDDRVFAYVDWTLNPGSHVETLSTFNQTVPDPIDLTGNELSQTLIGNAGNNILDGGGGGDTMFGLGGDDWYVVRDASDLVLEDSGSGSDRVFAYVDWTLGGGSHVEVLSTYNQTATDAIDLTGNELIQTIYGNEGNNILDGAGGSDTMVGYGGDDWYIVRNAFDLVYENLGGGSDRVFAYVDWTLNAGSEIELLTTYNQTTTEAIDLTGNELSQAIWGNAGDNILDSGGGGDAMLGFAGDDWFVVRSGADVVYENADEGADRVFAYVDWTLNAGSHVEVLSTYNPTTTEAIDLFGNELAQSIFGNAGANVLDGKGSSDVMRGDAGADVFAFTTALGGDNIDTILDFEVGVDKIAFAGISQAELAAGAFRTGTSAQDADDRIIYDSTTGALYYDGDGNGAGAAVQFATLAGAPIISANDFI